MHLKNKGGKETLFPKVLRSILLKKEYHGGQRGNLLAAFCVGGVKLRHYGAHMVFNVARKQQTHNDYN